ncbi:skin secretory protein xP2-like [Panicum virgatum]|uniref:skin secretory protein xP2-like n=1 Tax=Panicum virgatum TaxID=38727 RepID=UPI0019D62657|nr:skin secretory protein xP2-like [Panicum virgatum]
MAERRSPTPTAGRGSPSPVVGGGSSALATERRSPQPATGEGVPAPTMSTGGERGGIRADGLEASACSKVDTLGAGIEGRRCAAGPKEQHGQAQHECLLRAAPLAPVKALKTGARATPHTAPQPLPVVDIVAEAAKLQVAMARGTQAAQQALAPGNGGDAGQSGAEATAPVDAAGEVGRGDADDAAWPDVEAEVCRSGADSAAHPVAEEGSGGGAQERPANQTEVETLVPEPPRAGAEGVAEELPQRAPMVEETRVLAPGEAQDVGVVAVMTAPTVTAH